MIPAPRNFFKNDPKSPIDLSEEHRRKLDFMTYSEPFKAKHEGATMRTREMNLRLLKFIYDYRQENGFPPSVREICSELGYESTSSGKTLLENTQKRGWIQVNTKIPRGIKILAEGLAVLEEEMQ